MTRKQGNIGVTSENIFPIIKKFLYSDHEIFLRELVSNAVDATQKLKTLSAKNEYKGELGDLTIRLRVEDDKLIISDNGIGMTSEEIEKYINQIAISGAEEFMEKYKDDAAAIIGHFGLGFYSSFMVASKVEIDTLSYNEGAEPVLWSCTGTPSFEMQKGSRSTRGTDIILHIDEDNKEFLNPDKIKSLLKKYCHFLPVQIAFGYEQEWKDGKYVDTDKEQIINITEPTWTKKPSDLKDEDYLSFYNDLYPAVGFAGMDEPLFWIHLNIDYPFNLTGILYFPRIKDNIDLSKHKIQLYSNQVFVTENVEGIVPDYLNILHGVLDSPDIPLNVSRSYLQSDRNVKKISSYITRKVADKLDELFKEDRPSYEEKWSALELFVKYGMLTEEKFYDRAKKFLLLKNSEEKLYTEEEYRNLISSVQTDKDGKLVLLYSTNIEEQYSAVKEATDKGYDVLLLDGRLDMPLVSMLEQKWENVRFARVDSDAVANLIPKDEEKKEVEQELFAALNGLFMGAIPKTEGQNFHIVPSHMGADSKPVTIVRNEFMRRMKDMSQFQQGMNFYGNLPDSFELLVNVDHPIVQKIWKKFDAEHSEEMKRLNGELKGFKARRDVLTQQLSGDKTEEEKKTLESDLEETKKELSNIEEQRRSLFENYGSKDEIISQLIDLALLANGLLSGKQLDSFISRSLEIVGK
ncbi:MAG: molecular chaperone HtpG [Porphyromonas sp.]|nr:molecular chaperone HtpG [Porphyromonas sp.]